MEKVKLTKEQAEAIEYFVKGSNGDKAKLVFAHTQGSSPIDLDGLNLDTIIRALYIGYEVELTVEEQLLERYEAFQGCGEHVSNKQIFRDGFKAVLDIIGMKVRGIND